MRVTFKVGSYNSRRYLRPWIAKVTEWPIGRGVRLSFGGNVGAHLAEIEADPGDLVRYGQKDMRGRGSINAWGRVEDDGSISDMSAEAARDYWLERGK